ncbi:MAG: ABC transporter permease [Sphaerochaetaceae bacterium]|nr:ABC transporter permease [Sphaerochaetaceae bacterium]MDC7236691.1 ABC transporter permease [Sphaerochaetaceae bacterium]
MTNLKTNKLKEVMYTYGTIIALILIIILFGILNPRAFLSSTNFWNITRQMAILAVIALGATLIMCVSEFDLSVGNIASFSGVLAALLAINGVPFIFSLIIATLLSGILGLINGYIVTKFKVMSFIITLAMGRMIYGLTYWLSGGAIIFNDIPQSFKFIGTAKIGKIPYLTILMVIISLIFIYITKYTAFGRKLYAIGGNERASKVAGVKVEFNKTLAFALSGLMAGFAGVLLASRVGSASPTAGDAYNLNAYATIFIGITLFKEGVPNILGTLVGVAIFTVLANGLTILQVPTFIQNILTGLIIIIAVVGQKVGTSNND